MKGKKDWPSFLGGRRSSSCFARSSFSYRNRWTRPHSSWSPIPETWAVEEALFCSHCSITRSEEKNLEKVMKAYNHSGILSICTTWASRITLVQSNLVVGWYRRWANKSAELVSVQYSAVPKSSSRTTWSWDVYKTAKDIVKQERNSHVVLQTLQDSWLLCHYYSCRPREYRTTEGST